MSRLLLSSSLILFSLYKEVNGQLWCTETSECAGEYLDDSLMYCWGYISCAVSTIDGGLCDCAGFGACFGSTSTLTDDQFCESEDACALASINTEGDLYCGGYYACAGADPVNSTGLIECPGEAACRYMTITGASEGTYCFGDYGCWYTKITGTELVYSWGYRSTYFADIDTTGTDSFTVSFGGYYAGYQTIVVCASGSECEINCDNTNSCYLTSIFCYGDCDIDCDDDQDCPTVYDCDDDGCTETSSSSSSSSTSTGSGSGSGSGTNGNDDNEKTFYPNDALNARFELREKHKKEFSELMNNIHSIRKTNIKNKNSKIELHDYKEKKLAEFDLYVENEMKEWSKKYNQNFDPDHDERIIEMKEYENKNKNNNNNNNNMKNLNIAPLVNSKNLKRKSSSSSSSIKDNASIISSSSTSSSLLIPLICISILFVFSFITNAFLICKQNKKKLINEYGSNNNNNNKNEINNYVGYQSL